MVWRIDTTEQQLAELMRQWGADQSSVDLSRRVAKLWEERFALMQDPESLDGAVWYANHLNALLNGSDPAVASKLVDLQRRQIGAAIKKAKADMKHIEAWLSAASSAGHQEEAKYREYLVEMQRYLAELKMQYPADFKAGRGQGLN
jgi:hypothetical protein